MEQSLKLSKLNDYLQTIATVGAVVGLLAVVYEVRQSTRIAVATLDFEVSNNLSQINELLLGNPKLEDLINRANTGGEIAKSEEITLFNFNRRLLNAWTAMETAYVNGVLPRSSFDTAFDDITSSIQNTGPQRQRVWKRLFDSYPSLHQIETAKAAYIALARVKVDEVP